MDETTMTASLENLLEPAANTVPLHGRDAIAAMQLKSREEYRRVVFALAQVQMGRAGTVESVERVISVDLVADPATTNGVFESGSHQHEQDSDLSGDDWLRRVRGQLPSQEADDWYSRVTGRSRR